MLISRNIAQRLTLVVIAGALALFVPVSRLGAEPLPAPTALVGAPASTPNPSSAPSSASYPSSDSASSPASSPSSVSYPNPARASSPARASESAHPLSPSERLAALRAAQEAATNGMGDMSKLSPSQRLAVLRSTYAGPNSVSGEPASAPAAASSQNAYPVTEPSSAGSADGGTSEPLPQAVAVPCAPDETEQGF